MTTRQLAIQTALRKMAAQGWFSICTIDTILKTTGNVPEKEAYNTLHLLHCVNYADMPKSLRAELPDLLARALGEPGLKVELTPEPEPEPQRVAPVVVKDQPGTFVPAQEYKRAGFIARLLHG